ncbi:MAG: prolipoprotein diacylglyceryl transferase [bacterium]|nr:prolipoprotein diacylglyceryl transferase [bacterium]
MFWQTFTPPAVAFQLGPVTIYWYGVTMVLAIAAGVLIARQLAQRTGLAQPQAVYDLAFVVALAALLGARLYAVLLFWPDYAADPWEIVKVWHGGLAIHGALVAGALALLVYCRRKRYSFWAWADIIAAALPAGQAIGRWGNYFNQELFGPPTSLPWGIFIDPAHRLAGFPQATLFHPVFLYESLLNLALFLLLWRLFRHRRQVGVMVAAYAVGYGVIRLLMEQLRLDLTPELLGIRWPVVVSALLIIGGLVGLAGRQRQPAVGA